MIQAHFHSEEPPKDINPDKEVAYGAAVQAALLTQSGSAGVSNMLLLDVALTSPDTEMAFGIATIGASVTAGLNALRIVNEPTVVAIAYGLDQRAEKDLRCLHPPDPGHHLQDKATAGDPHLSGADFHTRRPSFYIAEVRRKHNTGHSRSRRSTRRPRAQCERAKRSFSSRTTATWGFTLCATVTTSASESQPSSRRLGYSPGASTYMEDHADRR